MAKSDTLPQAAAIDGTEKVILTQGGQTRNASVLELLAAPGAADAIMVGDRALSEVLASIQYPGMKITSLSVAPTLAEPGATVTANLTVVLTKNPTAQTVNGNAVPDPVTARTFAVSNVTVTTQFRWQVADANAPGGAVSDSRSVTLSFVNKGHAGFIDKSDATTLTATEVNGMAADWFATSIARTLNLTAGADGYLWYSQPANMPDPSAFKINGFIVSPVKTLRNHTPATANGQTTPYNHFRLGARLAAGATATLEVIA